MIYKNFAKKSVKKVKKTHKIVSGRNNSSTGEGRLARVRLHCYIPAVVLTYFYMTKGRVTLFRLKQLLRVLGS